MGKGADIHLPAATSSEEDCAYRLCTTVEKMLLTRVGGGELYRDHEYVRSGQMSHFPYGKFLYPSSLLPVAGGESGPKVIRESCTCPSSVALLRLVTPSSDLENTVELALMV